MDSVTEIVDAYQLEIECSGCNAKISQPIAWLRLHKDMRCPGCNAVIILGTSKINAAIRSVEKQMTELQRQLGTMLKSS